jgi:type I restriction enzyme S subunit
MATSQDFVNWVPTNALTSEWLQLVMIAERPAIRRFSKGAVHQTIYYPEWLAMHIALPPLAEQHRIVAKVDELMAVCDQLEAQLTTTQTDSRRLLEAVLHDALAPATDTVRAA